MKLLHHFTAYKLGNLNQNTISRYLEISKHFRYPFYIFINSEVKMSGMLRYYIHLIFLPVMNYFKRYGYRNIFLLPLLSSTSHRYYIERKFMKNFSSEV